jgi:hypothetical protein
MAYVELERPSKQRVIALSDIHADLEALIICLRDCANVIAKKDGYRFSQSMPDSDLYNQLYLASVHDPDYVADLHYQWVGKDTIVVIVGDLIDGARESDSAKKYKNSIEEVAYYPQVEIKILNFINAINVQAKDKNGGIIKIIGNHDYENFKGNEDMIARYTYTPDRNNPTYYKHPDGTFESREEFFQFGHTGYKLYQDTLGMYLLYGINDMLFVHGQLPSKELLEKGVNMATIKTINKLLHETWSKNRTYTIIGQETPMKFDTEQEWVSGYLKPMLEQYDEIIQDMLWSRTYGDIDEREDAQPDITPEQFEKQIRETITTFCGDLCGDDPANNVRVFIGHCQQHTVHQDPEPRELTTLGHVCARNPMVEIIDNASFYKGIPNSAKESNLIENKTFGIVTEFLNPIRDNLYQFLLYKIDVAMSRGQDFTEDYENLLNGKLTEENYFNPRVPQIIEVVGPHLRIHRSTTTNMSRHMKRDAYRSLPKSYISIYDIQHSSNKRKSKKKEKNNKIKA